MSFEKKFIDTRADIGTGMIDTLLDTAMDASTERLASKSKKNQVPAREANLLQPDQLDLELY